MASDTDIANGALAIIGDTATVASLSPPSGSIQAVHCARFYPMARDALLEMHAWDFATRRVQPALLAETPPAPWAYAYQAPSDVLNFLSITDPSALDDYSQGLVQYGNTVGIYTPQPFAVELDASGNQIILTNVQYAMLRYSGRVTDTTSFGPLFTEALTWLLASKLAGPVIKGSEGRGVAADCLRKFQAFLALATASDANGHRARISQSVDWMVNR